jgi:Lhr-like helicase
VLRTQFIFSVGARGAAQIQFWPSQVEAARRAVNPADDLVVALPTSAGKTRIAELCILRTLAAGRRVLYVTPLRALSAQVERGLAETFRPLGYAVSSLYGSAGVAAADVGALKASPIVVATPEKLDFAVRQEPSVIDDVGCVVLDEGHMIGLGTREIRYEVLVQRLLRRSDAASRRLVCLSAIFKAGDTFDDFTAWLRRDRPGTPIRSDWRPTRQRPAALMWTSGAGRLQVLVEGERPFVPKFVREEVPGGRRRKPFPQTANELVVATAKRLVADNHRFAAGPGDPVNTTGAWGVVDRDYPAAVCPPRSKTGEVESRSRPADRGLVNKPCTRRAAS